MEKPTGPMTVEVSIPTGTSVPGCEETNKCFIPSSVSIMKGDTVVWSNDDSAAHTVTSGSPADGPSGMFDSSLLIGGKSFEHTFDSSGSVDYFCMVHPWMTGSIQVS
jgi:plastocyanin